MASFTEESPPMSIIFSANQTHSHVTFLDVKKSYTPGVDITCRYNLSQHIIHQPKDWLGIFKVGWTTSRDYFTFVWAPPSTTGDAAQQEALFKAYYLPKDEEEYYQFCYVDQQGSVRGASSPFRFHCETEDDMVLVPTPGELESLQEKTKQNQEVKEKNELLAKENKDIKALHKQSQALLKELEEQNVGLQNQNSELQRQNTALQSQNKSLQCQNEERQKQIADPAPALQLKAAQMELASAKNEIKQITDQKEELQKQVESLVGRAEMLELKLKAQKDETSLIETERNNLREQAQKFKTDKDQLENSLRMTLDRISMLQVERADQTKEMEKISEDTDAKTKLVQKLMAEKELMQQTILSQETHLQDLENQLQKERQNIDELQQNLARQMSLQENPDVNPLRTPPSGSFVEVGNRYPENLGLVFGNPYGSLPETPSAVAKKKTCPYCGNEFEEDMCDVHIQLEHILKCQFCPATYSVLEKQVYDDHVFCHTMEDDF